MDQINPILKILYPVELSINIKDEDIVSPSSENQVASVLSVEDIIAVTTKNSVVSCPAVDFVITPSAFQEITASTTDQQIGAIATI